MIGDLLIFDGLSFMVLEGFDFIKLIACTEEKSSVFYFMRIELLTGALPGFLILFFVTLGTASLNRGAPLVTFVALGPCFGLIPSSPLSLKTP